MQNTVCSSAALNPRLRTSSNGTAQYTCMPGATDGRSREEPDAPQDQPQPLCRAASLSLCVLIQDPVDNLGPWLSGRKGICEQMKVFHEGMAGSS